MSWTFLHPGRLWLLVLLGLPILAVVLGAAQRRRRAVKFTNLDLLESIVTRRPNWRRHAATVLVLLGLGIGVLGLAQPYREEDVAQERSIIMLTLDVSLSMMADDVSPTRLDAAKEQAKEFVEQVDESIDIGLVSFSASVRLRAAPTDDRDEILAAIDRLELEEGTAIGDAIVASTDVIVDELAGADAEPGPLGDGATPAAIVILTDGETIEGLTTGPQGAQTAAQYEIPVYGIAFGTPEGTILLDDPATGEQYEQPVPVKYEELTEAAEITGGEFYAAESAGDLIEVYGDIETQLEPVLEVPEPERVELTIRYLAAALALLFAAFIAAQLLEGGLA